MTITMYGIKNCDTIRKARQWLERRDIAYHFHDYKTAGIDAGKLAAWIDELGWEVLLNRAGTTFRKLDPADRENLDRDKATMLMLANPSMIKRPVLDIDGRRIVGFKSGEYEEALGVS